LLPAQPQDHQAIRASVSSARCRARSAPVKPGERATFAINTSGMQFFDPGSGEAIRAA
jgi:hypothetical protein